MLIFLFVRYFLSTFQTAEIRRRPDNPETLSQCFLSLPRDTNSFTSCRQTIKAVSRASPPFLCFHFSLTVSSLYLYQSISFSLSPFWLLSRHKHSTFRIISGDSRRLRRPSKGCPSPALRPAFNPPDE